MRKDAFLLIVLFFIVVSCYKKEDSKSVEKEVIEFSEVEPQDNQVNIPPPPPPPPRKEVVSVSPEVESTAPLPRNYYKSKRHLQYDGSTLDYNTEDYAPLVENEFHQVSQNPLSTFSIDVDRASYSNVRRFINNGQLPPKHAVRIEEMINYFDYQYQNPDHEHPYDLQVNLTDSPWNKDFQLAHISLQAERIKTEDLPPSNLVFLVDVSGSMQSSNKLPLLKSGFNLLIDNLREEDQVSIVVYAGAAGMVLPPTAGNKKEKIREAINNLTAGGSTAGSAGIKLAYKIADEQFLKKGNNRVILATDGDFNVGMSSDGALQELIEEKRESGVFLSVLGFGMGNYKDNKMEILADKGNGNYAYIDSIAEARKVFVSEFGGTLFTVAKDVKLQVEFNPSNVEAYRLIGYENRLLNDKDFNDDTKDAGELGAGHSVTAIFEIIPKGVESDFLKGVDKLKYQTVKPKQSNNVDILTVKTRYKLPDEDKSQLFDKVLTKNRYSPLEKQNEAVQFSIAVAEFGLLLRDSAYKGDSNYEHVSTIIRKNKGEDEEGYRSEFLQMVKSASLMNREQVSK